VIAYAALAGAVIAIAWSAIFVRWTDIPGSASAFYRVAIAAAILIPWRALTTPDPNVRPASTRRPAAWRMAVAAGIFFALDLAFFNTAVMRTSAATTSLLGSNAPVFVGLGSWLLLRKRPHALFWAGLAASMCGAVLMIWPGLSGDVARNAPPQNLTGDLMAVAAGFCFAGYLLAVSKARESMDTLSINAISMAASTLTLLPLCLAIDAPLSGYTGTTWMALFFLGVVSQVGAYLCIAYALGHLPATVVSTGLLGQGPLSIILIAIVLGERLSAIQLAGGALVLLGIYIVTRAET
jgi:drug/metabolite transporter (DMT)-like permease